MRCSSEVVDEYWKRPVSVTIPAYSASATGRSTGQPRWARSVTTIWAVAPAVGSIQATSPNESWVRWWSITATFPACFTSDAALPNRLCSAQSTTTKRSKAAGTPAGCSTTSASRKRSVCGMTNGSPNVAQAARPVRRALRARATIEPRASPSGPTWPTVTMVRAAATAAATAAIAAAPPATVAPSVVPGPSCEVIRIPRPTRSGAPVPARGGCERAATPAPPPRRRRR